MTSALVEYGASRGIREASDNGTWYRPARRMSKNLPNGKARGAPPTTMEELCE